MKIIFFTFFGLFCLNLFSQNPVGYLIDNKNNKLELFEIETKKDSTFFMTPRLYFWNKYGTKLSISSNKLKEININNAFYTWYTYFKNLKKLKKNRSKKAFGQLLISSHNYLLYYSVTSIQATKGNPVGTLYVIRKSDNLLVETYSLPRKSLISKKEEINKILLKYFQKCPKVFENYFKRFKYEHLVFTNYIFNGFEVDNCN